MPDDSRIDRTPLEGPKKGAGQRDLSPEMKPYFQLALALKRGLDAFPELETIRQLPLEKRYVWRMAVGLARAFGDFSDTCISADRETLIEEDFSRLMDVLQLCPAQFCILLKELFGADQMQQIMAEAIRTAKLV